MIEEILGGGLFILSEDKICCGCSCNCGAPGSPGAQSYFTIIRDKARDGEEQL